MFDEVKSFILNSCIDSITKGLPEKDHADFRVFANKWYQHLDMQYKLTLDPSDAKLFLERNWQALQATKKVYDTLHVVDVSTMDYNKQQQSYVKSIDFISKNQSFIVDSLIVCTEQNNWAVHKYFYIAMPIVRDAEGCYLGVDESQSQKNMETFFMLMLKSSAQSTELSELKNKFNLVLEDINAVNRDFSEMKKSLVSVKENWQAVKSLAENYQSTITELTYFIDWLEQGNFIYTGTRQYKLTNTDSEALLKAVPQKSLGLFSIPRNVHKSTRPLLQDSNKDDAFSYKKLFYFTKTNMKSTIRASVYSDMIGMRLFSQDGSIIGELRLVGLLTESSRNTKLTDVPLIRGKIAETYNSAKLLSHYHRKSLARILDNLPRQELFQAKWEDLYRVALNLLMTQGTSRVRVFLREDFFKSFTTAIVTIPSIYFVRSTPVEIREIFKSAFNCNEIDISLSYPMTNYIMVYYTIQEKITIDSGMLEQKICWAVLPWQDKIEIELTQHYGTKDGAKLARKFGSILSKGYLANVSWGQLVKDIENMVVLGKSKNMHCVLEHCEEEFEGKETSLLRIYMLNTDFVLSDIVPILDNMGVMSLRQRKYEFNNDHDHYRIMNISITAKERVLCLTGVRAQEFLNALINILDGQYTNDCLNILLLMMDTTVAKIDIIRTYIAYLEQIRCDFSAEFMREAIITYPNLTEIWLRLFTQRFETKIVPTSKKEQTEKDFCDELNNISLLNHEKVFRLLHECLFATVRTNYFLVNKTCIACKIMPERISIMPHPKPKIETFIYAKQVVGTHVRMDNIARGGIRWSDRAEDYRTEVLGLMQAQQLKNSVIAPEGGKGVFFIREMQKNRSAADQALECYRIFIHGLMDMSDNIKDSKCTKLKAIRRYDGEDPYLVVAADKGTATFSDYANDIALQRAFWLGDAFASGGKHGYDHKKIGITANGAWQSLDWHMKKLGVSIKKDDITMIGIGDMSGDVFGNGLLYSKKIKLLAAFDHRHIFLDPNPDPLQSYKERERICKLKRSSWNDYSPQHISKGGAVYPRAEKYISLSKQVKEMLDIDEVRSTPDQIIQAILRAKVDVIFNGGIGTYIKSSDELDEDVGDTNNKECRISADSVRASCIVEGGNLGITQRGRVEYALAGGLINQDALDNSGGVLCSDFEVNIKILLNTLVSNGAISYHKRNQLLSRYQKDVIQLVLTNNYLLNLNITMVSLQAKNKMPIIVRYIQYLYREGIADMSVDHLPSEKIIKSRMANNQALTRPEISVLLSYARIEYIKTLTGSDLVKDPACLPFLYKAFPDECASHYQECLHKHPLRNRIIATKLGGFCIRIMGLTYAKQMVDELGCTLELAIKAFIIVINIFELQKSIYCLDQQKELLLTHRALLFDSYLNIRSAARHMAAWMVVNKEALLCESIDCAVSNFKDHVIIMKSKIEQFNSEESNDQRRKTKRLMLEAGISKGCVEIVAAVGSYVNMLPIIDAWNRNNKIGLIDYAAYHSALYERLRIKRLVEFIDNYSITSLWTQIGKIQMLSDIDKIAYSLTKKLLDINMITLDSSNIRTSVEDMMSPFKEQEDNWHQVIDDIAILTEKDFAIFTVVMNKLKDLHEELCANKIASK